MTLDRLPEAQTAPSLQIVSVWDPQALKEDEMMSLRVYQKELRHDRNKDENKP